MLSTLIKVGIKTLWWHTFRTDQEETQIQEVFED